LVGGNGSKNPAAAQIIVQGEFRGMARWLTSPRAASPPSRIPEPERPAAGIDAGSEDPLESGDELGALLASIADDVHHRATAARNGVLADFAGRAMHARRHLSRHLIAATLAAIKEARKAALALIAQNARLELSGRKEAAIAAWRSRASAPGGRKQGPPDARPELR
jgi:hypothetical protein